MERRQRTVGAPVVYKHQAQSVARGKLAAHFGERVGEVGKGRLLVETGYYDGDRLDGRADRRELACWNGDGPDRLGLGAGEWFRQHTQMGGNAAEVESLEAVP